MQARLSGRQKAGIRWNRGRSAVACGVAYGRAGEREGKGKGEGEGEGEGEGV